MKIGILGSRGIPNHYGGFEQFAEYVSVALVGMGHDVYVYNSHVHPYQEKNYKGVHILHCYDAEPKLGTGGQFIYDLNCILNSRKQKFDVLLQLGYTSSSVWGWLLPAQTVIVTNMDGLEWKRTKFSANVQTFLKWAEKLAVLTSDYLIADSVGIQLYLQQKYEKDAAYIPYGAHVYLPIPEDISYLKDYDLTPESYNMLVARLEPENSIEIILDGVLHANDTRAFLVIGNHNTKYGVYLKQKYTDARIRFLGGVYNQTALNALRFYSHIYFHGHTVGGTNPSLLEAMASGALICAHHNIFNESICGTDAFYFTNANDVAMQLMQPNAKSTFQGKINNNIDKINTLYNWPTINRQYEAMLLQSVKAGKKK